MFDEQEKQLINEFVKDTLREKRRARRWNIFSRLVIASLILGVLATSFSQDSGFGDFHLEHTALIKVSGPIFYDSMASADNINKSLREAYENETVQGVILELNTPGGSPVQASRIYTQIKTLRETYPDKPLYAVISDICASGGMYIAVAADEIYADHASLVGSIGVVMGGFGFEEAIEKIGVERRLMTAGEHKGMLDPFLPQDPEEVQHVQTLLNQVHKQFIMKVKEGRGDKLSGDPDLFSGFIWTGERAKELGLVDGFGDVSYVAKELIKQEKVVEYKIEKRLLEKLMTDTVGALANQWSLMNNRINLY